MKRATSPYRRSRCSSATVGVVALGLTAEDRPATGRTLTLAAALPRPAVPKRHQARRRRQGAPEGDRVLRPGKELADAFEVEWANLSGGPQTPRRSGPRRWTSARSRTSRRSTRTGPASPRRSSPPEFRQDPLNHPIYQLGIAPGRGRQDAGGPARQEDRLQPGPGAGRAGAPGAAEGRADQGGRRSWSSCPAPATSTRTRWPPSRSTSRRSAASRSSGTWPSTARTAPPRSRTACATTPATSTRRSPVARRTRRKAAAIRAVRRSVWARARRWSTKHPEEWIEGYYVKDQGLTAADGQWLVEKRRRGRHPGGLERRDPAAAGDHRPARQGDRQQGDPGQGPLRPRVTRPSPPTRSR